MTPSPDTREQAWNAAMLASPGALDQTITPTAIEGTIPAALRGGRVLSNGPGWSRIGGRLAHPFDGHGYVRSFEFGAAGEVRLRARFVETLVYRHELAAQRLTHRGLGTNIGDHFWQNLSFGGEARNVANTTIVPWNGKLLAGWEGGAPYALDPDSLDTLGEETFEGALSGQATLAHMKHDVAAGRLVTCSIQMGRTTTLTFRELDAGGRLVHTRVAPLPGMLFAHDFTLTPSWYILASNPLVLKWGELARSMLGASTLMNAIATDPAAPGELYLIPRGAPGPMRTVRLPGRTFVVHYGNAFELDGTVNLDACLFEAFNFGEEFGFRGPKLPLDPTLPDRRAPQRLHRITVAAGADHATWRQLTPFGVDFPNVHPEHEGRETPLLFGATRADVQHSDPFDSVLRVDLRDPSRPAQIWTAGEDCFVGEPLFVPSAEQEDRGHVVVVVTEPRAARSSLLVFDASDLEKGPLARVPLPLLPVAFHGAWVG